MKSFFFAFLLPILVSGILLVVVLYLFGQSIGHFFGTWFWNREMDELATEGQRRREVRLATARARLDTGCEHQWSDQFSGFPPDVCVKCGIEKTKPAGNCDHVWRAEPGSAPASRCGKCDKTHGGVTGEESPTLGS